MVYTVSVYLSVSPNKIIGLYSNMKGKLYKNVECFNIKNQGILIIIMHQSFETATPYLRLRAYRRTGIDNLFCVPGLLAIAKLILKCACKMST